MESDAVYAAVDIGPVSAEWVEAVVATAGQPTIVDFHDTGRSPDGDRRFAEWLAVSTGARVLRVECGCSGGVEDGVRAYLWLLNEGVDLRTTAFVDEGRSCGLAAAVLACARKRDLPLPHLGVLDGMSVTAEFGPAASAAVERHAERRTEKNGRTGGPVAVSAERNDADSVARLDVVRRWLGQDLVP